MAVCSDVLIPANSVWCMCIAQLATSPQMCCFELRSALRACRHAESQHILQT
jgi:hypothetical protein